MELLAMQLRRIRRIDGTNPMAGGHECARDADRDDESVEGFRELDNAPKSAH
jgi:hypothetical protein